MIFVITSLLVTDCNYEYSTRIDIKQLIRLNDLRRDSIGHDKELLYTTEPHRDDITTTFRSRIS